MKRVLKTLVVFITAAVLCVQLSGCSALIEILSNMTFHTSVPFKELHYTEYDITYFNAVATDIEDMLESKTEASTVLARFEQLSNELYGVYTANSLASIYNYLDVSDEKAAQNYLTSYDISITAQDTYNTIGNKIVTSYCAEDAKAYMGEDNFNSFIEYVPLSEELSALLNEEQALIGEYSAAADDEYTVTYAGKSITFANYMTSELTNDQMNEAVGLLYEKKNAAVAPIYLKLIAKRAEILKLTDYETYADYCFDKSFMRGYTNAEVSKVYDSVKTYFGPLLKELSASYTDEQYSEFYYDTDNLRMEDLLNKVSPKLKSLDSGMTKSLNFMKKYGYYNIEYSEKKMNASFTSLLYSYNAPFMFVQPSGSTFDLFTLVHEFGHYNAMYNNPYAATDMETSEVHSTALELLFMNNYKSILGSSASAIADNIILEDAVEVVITGCLVNEFESTVYEENISTVDELNELMMKLYRDYGYIDESDTRTKLYSWVDIAHVFLYPFYYISYSVSSTTSLALWIESNEHYVVAFDKYREIVDADGSMSFTELMKTIGVKTIFDENAVKEIAEDIGEYIKK